MYSEIVREPQLYLDLDGEFYPEATVFIMTGEHLGFLYHVLHTKTVTFLFKTFYAGGGLGETGYRYKKAFLEKLPVPHEGIPERMDELNAEEIICDMYGLSTEEKLYITRLIAHNNR